VGAVVVICDLMELVAVSEKTLSLACASLNVSAVQKLSHLYAQLTYALAQVGCVCLCALNICSLSLSALFNYYI